MSRQTKELLGGALTVLVGVLLILRFEHVETPVIGLRQTGVVLAVIGMIELAFVGWEIHRSRR